MIDGHDKASALAAIEGLLHAEARGGRRCLLVVDEAQNLSIEAIEELTFLRSGESRRLQPAVVRVSDVETRST